MKRGLIVLALLLSMSLAAGSASAAVRMRATVDSNRISSGESIQLMITVSGGEAEVDTSPITDFSVRSQGTSSRIQIINGHTSREVVYTYLLIPRHTGELTIPALAADIDGQRYQTDPITVTVSAQAADKGDDGGHGDVFVTATVSDEHPFAGQQVIYTFSLYNAVQVTDARFQPPQFEGFTAKEIENRRSFQKAINGRDFAVVQIDYVLVPMQPGNLTIEPAVLQVGIVSQEKRRGRSPFDDFFDSPLFNQGRVTPKVVQTEPISLTVRPLPPFQGPGAYSGLVGQFEMSATVDNTQLKVGDSATVTLTIKGKGNIMDAQAPELGIPDAFKSYPDTPQEQVQLDRDGYSGEKVFRVALVPVKAGKFELAPASLSYFDTVQGRHRTLKVALPAIYVTPGAPADGAPMLVTPQEPGTVKEQVAFTGRDILPLKEDLDALKPYRRFSPWFFLLGMVVPGVAFGGLLWAQRLGRRDAGPAARMKVRANLALKAARSALPDTAAAASAATGADHGATTAFVSHLYQALTAAIFSAAGRNGEALTWKEAEHLLIESGLAPDIARKAADILSTVESARFSGMSLPVDQCRQILAETQQLVRRLAP